MIPTTNSCYTSLPSRSPYRLFIDPYQQRVVHHFYQIEEQRVVQNSNIQEFFRRFLHPIPSTPFNYMQRQRNSLPPLHEIHVQQRVFLGYTSHTAQASPTALVRIAIPTASLQIELVHDLLVVEQILHHLSTISLSTATT